MTHKWGRMATYPELGDSQLSLQEERPHGETAHSMRVICPLRIALTLGQVEHATLGRTLRFKGFAAILGKTAKIHRKVVPRTIVSPYHKRKEPRAFAWMQTEALLPFCNNSWGSKHNESIFNTSIFEVHSLWEKVHISAILA